MFGDKIRREHICKNQDYAKKKRGLMPVKSTKILNLITAKFLNLKFPDKSYFKKF